MEASAMTAQCPPCHHWVACHWKAFSWVYLYLPNELCLIRCQQLSCRVSPLNVITKWPTISRPSLEYNFMVWRALCLRRPEQWSIHLNECHGGTPYDLKTISWVALYLLEELCPRRPQQCHHPVVCHFKTLPWIEVYWLEQLSSGKPTEWSAS